MLRTGANPRRWLIEPTDMGISSSGQHGSIAPRKGPPVVTDRRNTLLAHWVSRAHVSYGRLATELARTAADHGHRDIRPDRSRVARWITNGEQPRPPVPDLLAATLTRLCHLPRPLTPTDLGLVLAPRSPTPTGSWHPQAVVASLLHTTRSDAMSDDATPVPARLLAGPELLRAAQGWLHLPDPDVLTPRRPGRIGTADVLAIQQTTDAFRQLDNAHGGALCRRAVVGQLHHVTELAGHGSSTDTVARGLFVAVADLASVAGWMTHDIGRHAESQRYFLLGLQAAKQAGPAGLAIAAHILNCLARQANHLNRPADALDLVQAAQYGTRKLPPGRLHALLATLEARCHAVLGQLPATARALGTADHHLAVDAPDAPPSWAEWFDTAEHHVTVGVCELLAAHHDPTRAQHAIEMVQRGTAARPQERTRSRAFDQILLARAHLAADQPDAADTATTDALALFGQATSTRVADRLTELDHELSLHPSATAATIRERLRPALAAGPADAPPL